MIRIDIKKKIFFVLMASILFFQNCAPSKVMKITAVPYRDQKIGYDETITSQKKHFVLISPYSRLAVRNKTMFMMSIQNLGEAPLDISNENISVTFEDNTDNGRGNILRVQPAYEFMNDFETDSRLKEFLFLKGALSSFEAMSLSCVAGANSFTDNSSNSFSMCKGAGEILHETRIELQMMHEQNQQTLEAIPDFVLSRQIIMPGDGYTGVVVCDTPQLNPAMEGNYIISVLLDEEKHDFVFSRKMASAKQ